MAVSVVHPFVSGIADSGDPTIVQPSDWNAAHTITGLGTAAEAAVTDFATAAQGAEVSSGRLAAIAQLITNWDTTLSNGFYQAAAGATGSPDSVSGISQYFFAVVLGNGGNFTSQEGYYLGSSSTDTRRWRRVRASGVWGTWYQTTLSKAELDARYQLLDADLTSWAAITRASGFDTFTATPSSANLRALLSDETGTGAAVFATSPTLVTPLLGTPASGVMTNVTGLPLTSGVTGTLPVANGGTGITNLSSFVQTLLDDTTATAFLTTLGIVSGTWTPVTTFVTPGDLSVSYSTQSGTYLKVGGWVVAAFNLVFTPTYTTASGTFAITGLPFTATDAPIGTVAFIAGATVPTYPASCTSIALTLNTVQQQFRITGQGSGTVTAFSVTEFTSGVVRAIRGTMIYPA